MEFWGSFFNTMLFILTILKFKLILIGLLLLLILTQKQKLKATNLCISTCNLRGKMYIPTEEQVSHRYRQHLILQNNEDVASKFGRKLQ